MMAPLWPDWIENTILAKSVEAGKDGVAESLARHTWYVLEKLSEAIRLRPYLPIELGLPNLWNCLFWACFIHDFGKASQGFQDRLRGGAKWPHRHEILSLAFIDWISNSLSEEENLWVSAAVISHHKDANEIQLLYMDTVDSDDDPLIPLINSISTEAMSGLWRWLKECPVSWIETLGLSNAGIRVASIPQQHDAIKMVQLQGFRRIRDSLKANRLWLKTLNRSSEQGLIIGTLALRGNLISADHQASAHINDLPSSPIANPFQLLDRLEISERNLYTHQTACITTHGSAILASPTGSGKTESALLWACAQSHENLPVPRLFYTLPYQASMNAMYSRLNNKAFPGKTGLEHSRSIIALYRDLLSDDYSPEQASRAAKWSKNLARLNYFPIRILSPYQILKAPFRLKGYEALLCDFFDAAFILDEIHTYDPDRLGMIMATVKYLRKKYKARFFIMSATLPRILLARLSDALGDYTLIKATPQLYAKFCRHKLHVLEDDLFVNRWIEYIVEIAKNGQSVLVCCNTVKRAQHVYAAIKQITCVMNIDVILLHGRFNNKDRLGKEIIIQNATGAFSRERRPIVLVATQVVEVSLDIDLDVIFTDPAPLEALIQRFGRINRRRLKESAPVYVFTKPSDGQGIYSDDLIQAALRILCKNANQMINEENISDWLDDVYKGSIAEQWNLQYKQSYTDFENSCISTLRAFNSDSYLENAFYQAFDSIEVLPACLENNYCIMLNQDQPIEASQLLVPLRWHQFWKLKREGRVREDNANQYWPKVVDADYTERGLEL